MTFNKEVIRMFWVFLMIVLLVTLAFLFVVLCGTGTDGQADSWAPAPVEPTFVTRDYSF